MNLPHTLTLSTYLPLPRSFNCNINYTRYPFNPPPSKCTSSYAPHSPQSPCIFSPLNGSIQVVNDDGPPSKVSSPYIHSFVTELRSIGATVSVVLPHTQRSWIAKAHLVGKTVTPTYFRPGTLHADDGTTHDRPRPDGDDGDEWVLVDGTPASCAQIGIHHYFQEKGPIDLVVSGWVLALGRE